MGFLQREERRQRASTSDPGIFHRSLVVSQICGLPFQFEPKSKTFAQLPFAADEG